VGCAADLLLLSLAAIQLYNHSDINHCCGQQAFRIRELIERDSSDGTSASRDRGHSRMRNLSDVCRVLLHCDVERRFWCCLNSTCQCANTKVDIGALSLILHNDQKAGYNCNLKKNRILSTGNTKGPNAPGLPQTMRKLRNILEMLVIRTTLAAFDR
jgi:hypothetical protein